MFLIVFLFLSARNKKMSRAKSMFRFGVRPIIGKCKCVHEFKYRFLFIQTSQFWATWCSHNYFRFASPSFYLRIPRNKLSPSFLLCEFHTGTTNQQYGEASLHTEDVCFRLEHWFRCSSYCHWDPSRSSRCWILRWNKVGALGPELG